MRDTRRKEGKLTHERAITIFFIYTVVEWCKKVYTGARLLKNKPPTFLARHPSLIQ